MTWLTRVPTTASCGLKHARALPPPVSPPVVSPPVVSPPVVSPPVVSPPVVSPPVVSPPVVAPPVVSPPVASPSAPDAEWSLQPTNPIAPATGHHGNVHLTPANILPPIPWSPTETEGGLWRTEWVRSCGSEG